MAEKTRTALLIVDHLTQKTAKKTEKIENDIRNQGFLPNLIVITNDTQDEEVKRVLANLLRYHAIYTFKQGRFMLCE